MTAAYLPWLNDAAPAELMKLLARFTYKPRWTFRLEPADGWPGQWMLLITTWVQDIRPPHNWGHGAFTVPVPPISGEAHAGYWEHWLRDTIWHVAERHEVDEWFTVDGQRPYDPHARKEAGSGDGLPGADVRQGVRGETEDR